MFDHIPPPKWVDLRTPQGKLLGRLDVQRGLLEIKQHGKACSFDLLALTKAPTTSPPPSPSAPSPPSLSRE